MSQTTSRYPFAILLGVNEIASATGIRLLQMGYRVLLSHDPDVPVIRRRMAFHDVLYGDSVQIEGVAAGRVDDAMQLLRFLRRPPSLGVTWLGLLDLLTVSRIDLLIDARMQKHRVTPDLRRLANLTIGLGPGFSSEANCDVAIETRPGRVGVVSDRRWTDAPDHVASRLGDVGSERFVYSPFAGRWRTPVDIGTRIYKGFVVGHLEGTPIPAPRDGFLRGIVRDGLEVPANVKLIELDPRERNAQWTGTDERGRAIALATAKAVSLPMPVRAQVLTT